MKTHFAVLLFAAAYCLFAAYEPARGQTVAPVDQQQMDAITSFVDLLLNCVLKLSQQDQIDMMNSANNLAAKVEQLKEICAKIQENPFRFLDLVFALAENNQLIISEAFKIIDFRQFDKWVQLVVDILLKRLAFWANMTTTTQMPTTPPTQNFTFNWNVTWVTGPMQNFTLPPWASTPFPNGSWPTWPSNVTAPPFTWPTWPSNVTGTPQWPTWPSNVTATPFTWPSWPANFTMTPYPNGTWPNYTMPTWPSNVTAPPFTWPTWPSNVTGTPYPNASWPTWWPSNVTMTPYTWPSWPANFTMTPFPNGSWPTWPSNVTMPPFTWPTVPSNVTGPPVTWPTFPSNFTLTPYPNGSWPNYTMPSWWPQNYTASPVTWPTFPANFTFTPYPNGSWPNYTLPSWAPSSTGAPLTWPTVAPSNSTIAPPTERLLKDPSYCDKYTYSDCSLTASETSPINPAPYICIGLCTCSPKLKCLNNGIMAYNLNYKCMCICEPGFTGAACETPVPLQREMCLPSLLEQGGCLKESVRIACPSLCAGFTG